MRSFRIGSLFGIPIEVDLTFLVVLPLFAYLIGSRAERIAVDVLNGVWNAGIDPAVLVAGNTEWLLGLVAAVGLFVGVVLHELGHSLVAMRYGYEIDSITLWIFGGVASLAEMPEDWRQELTIAVAGPAVSVVLGVGCYGAFLAIPAGVPTARFVVGYLAILNGALAAFNMLPGFPMDGGRVLRALLARRRPHARATGIAAEVGKAVALLLGLVGLFGNFLLIGLAVFIYIGAASEAQGATLKAAFEGVTVSDVMTPADELDVVAPGTSVADLVGRMLREHHTGYPVMDGDRLVGMVTLADARDVQPVERDAFTVADVMSDDLVAVDPAADAMTAITTMQSENVGRLPVTDARGHLVGIVSRTDLVNAFDIIRSSQPTTHRTAAGTVEGTSHSGDHGDDPEVRR